MSNDYPGEDGYWLVDMGKDDLLRRGNSMCKGLERRICMLCSCDFENDWNIQWGEVMQR